MYNSPIIDIAIGLVFIFLLYSLLATSVQEAIATIFSLRASMLKKCIIDNMLSDASVGNQGIKLNQIPAFFGFFSTKKGESLGKKFYEHPVIKNYGESKFFPLPSYIPKNNFPSVLIDIFLKDFSTNIGKISDHKIAQGSIESEEALLATLKELPEVYKIKELLTFHLCKYDDKTVKHSYFIACDTCRILEMHLRNSNYDLAAFSLRLEGWFDDSMNRVSGWYKRQSQLILFFIGIVFAILFNVDTLLITDKLSTDKDARDKLVNMAIDAAERYKDDPRVKNISKNIEEGKTIPKDSVTLKQLNEQYEKQTKEIKRMLNNDIKESGEVLALGWKQFGRTDEDFIEYLKTKYEDKINYNKIRKKIDSINLKELNPQKKLNPKKLDSLANDAYYVAAKAKHPLEVRITYMWKELSNNPRSLLGYLILAFGICLGAPFWFDLLNKLINIRGAGKKENSNPVPAPASGAVSQPVTQPVTMTINNQQTGEEAVG